ncbi:hypothetical protein BCF11_3798 [Collimonas sp. PA-H2]|uniref:hypothetical protein n=1 Tax=Collimonas sp. PA-H2 TaxID=1881062 RepID=UPI000BF25D90|nr:hypothetical protein [Collimonas sp. PA-H2]PFH11352.1 hypothetical protein BCF11_3798 [Collimonas sp. PA-H2]
MKKTILLAVCFFMQSLLPAYAAQAGKFAYCGGLLKFNIPDFFDKPSIEKQSGPITCKDGFIIKSKVGNKKETVDIRKSTDYFMMPKDFNEEFLAQFKENYPQRLNFSYNIQNKNGSTTVLTFYWLDDTGRLKKIDKEFYFGKQDSMSAHLSYAANPNDSNDVLFMNALEQLFLSMEIDW